MTQATAPKRGTAVASPLSSYLKAIAGIPRLEREDEVRLAGEIARGNNEAANTLVLANLYLVVRIARNYRRQNTSMLDLINEGNIGLLKAVRKFNPDFGIRFSSYASWWIKQRISIYLIQHTKGSISIPIRKVLQVYNLNREAAVLQNRLLRKPTVGDLSHWLQQPKEQIQETLNIIPEYLNIEDCLGASATADAEGAPVGGQDHLCSVPSRVERNVTQEHLRSVILDMLDCLSERERTGVKLFYGLTGGPQMNYASLGRRLSISREGARQLIKRSLGKLRTHPRSSILKEYLTA